MTAPVFLATDLECDVATVKEGDIVRLGGKEGRHAAGAKRLQVGELLDIVDGAGLRLNCEVKAVDGHTLTLAVLRLSSDRAATLIPQLVLVQALAKGGRDEQAIEAATELGVHRIIPWQSDRAIVRWNGQKADRGVQKWLSTVTAATKVSRRAQIPAVSPVVTTKQLAVQVKDAINAGALVLVLHEDASTGILQTLRLFQRGEKASETAPLPREIWMIVGPEGGIGETELAALASAGGQIVRMGPHVLRAASAGPAALAVIGAESGLWDLALTSEGH